MNPVDSFVSLLISKLRVDRNSLCLDQQIQWQFQIYVCQRSVPTARYICMVCIVTFSQIGMHPTQPLASWWMNNKYIFSNSNIIDILLVFMYIISSFSQGCVVLLVNKRLEKTFMNWANSETLLSSLLASPKLCG